MSEPYICGSRAALELVLQIQRANKLAIASTGDIDPEWIAALLEAAIHGEKKSHKGLMLALAEYIGTAVNGSAIDPQFWTPLQHVRPQRRDASEAH